jgi:hypothetical protein
MGVGFSVMTRLASAILVALAACGPKAADVAKARESVYQTEYANVWNAAQAEVNERFADRIKIADASKGYIETQWESVEASVESTLGDGDMKANARNPVGARNMFRLFVRIEQDGPPWKVNVDGEAAHYTPGMSVLQPFKHGADDEPQWVPGRIDAARMGIYERLKQYAVAPPPARTP